MQKVTPADVAEGLTEFWSQQVVGSAHGNLFKVAKGIGSTTWHTHEDQEETFLILSGRLTIRFRSGDVHLSPGDLLVIPCGVEHCPHAEEEAHFLLVGPDATSNAAGGSLRGATDSLARPSRPAGSCDVVGRDDVPTTDMPSRCGLSGAGDEIVWVSVCPVQQHCDPLVLGICGACCSISSATVPSPARISGAS